MSNTIHLLYCITIDKKNTHFDLSQSESHISVILNLSYVFFSYNENRKVMDFGFPRSISDDFPGVNATINAAFYKRSEYIAQCTHPLGNMIPNTVCTYLEESIALGAC